MRHHLLSATVAALCSIMACTAHAQPARTAISAAVANTDRSPEARARDRYRHPAETLAFFEVEPDQTVVEFLPGGGWYTNILAPLTKNRGHYIALVPAGSKAEKTTEMLLAAHSGIYGRTALATISFANGATSLPPNSVDRLLTFRNIHNLLPLGPEALGQIFEAFFAALKPGGILGISEHRLPEDRDPRLEYTSGYVKQSTVVRLAEAAGFRLAAASEINANPKDGADWPNGVWTLPPIMKLGDQDRDRYIAIGESDRMTLKFVKSVPFAPIRTTLAPAVR